MEVQEEEEDDMVVDVPRPTPIVTQPPTAELLTPRTYSRSKFVIYYEVLNGSDQDAVRALSLTGHWDLHEQYRPYDAKRNCAAEPHSHLLIINATKQRGKFDALVMSAKLNHLLANHCQNLVFLVLASTKLLPLSTRFNVEIGNWFKQLGNVSLYTPHVQIFHYSTLVRNLRSLQVMSECLERLTTSEVVQ